MPVAPITLHRVVGDRLTPIAAQLFQGGAAISLAGKTVLFHMVDAVGNVIVNEQSATIDVEASGKVSYGLAANDVDEAGTFWMWFIVVGSGSKRDSFPANGRSFKLVINPKTES